MRKFGLIGYPLKHSFSKKYFTDKFEKEGLIGNRYDLYEIEDVSQIKEVLDNNPGLVGLNVTIPYKEQVIPYLTELEEGCREIGAVNTIKIAQGKLVGFNTDYFGFKESLVNWLPEKRTKALILGSGGACRAVKQALNDLEIPFLIVSRTKTAGNERIVYGDLNEQLVRDYPLIINTTPLGTYPNMMEMPEFPISLLTAKHRVYDLIYNPEETRFMQSAREKGALVKNGLEMLHLQAEAAWEIWNKT